VTKNIRRPVFVVFEGLDGTGKTTCARRTAELLGAQFLTTPSPSVRRFRDDLLRDLGASQEARQLFYLATVFAASEEVRALLATGRSVVLDRYFLSTQAYAEFRGSRLRVDELQERLLPADVTVLLEASLETRRSRIAARGGSVADGETLSVGADAYLREAHLRRLAFPVIGSALRMRTDAMGPGEIASDVLAALMRMDGHDADEADAAKIA
jgi:dTMP kinase